MKLAVYEYQLRLSVRSSVTGYANAAELYLKKIMFGEDAVKVSSKVDHVIDVDPLREAQRLNRFIDSEVFTKVFGQLSTDWVNFIKKFEYKQNKTSKSASKAKNEEEVAVEEVA